MNKTVNFFPTLLVDLQLFADGTGGGTGAEGTTGVNATAAVSQSGVNKGKSDSLSDIKYGIQENDAEETNPEAQVADVQKTDDANNTPDLNAEFEELINGKYKDQYGAKMQDTIQKRLKSTKEGAEKYEALAPTLEILAKKYGVDPTDVKALNKAIEDDDSYFEADAMERGMSVAEFKNVRKIEKENAEFHRMEQERRNKEAFFKKLSAWDEQGKRLKTVYPSFDLKTELKNQRFAELINVPGLSLRDAYELIHRDEIMTAGMQYAQQVAEQKLVNNIRANGARPVENGNSAQSASLVKSDVSQLSNADMDEINRRVARGEKITFGRSKRK